MELEETNQPQITNVTLFVYEGDLEYDENGNITNKLRETLTYDKEQSNGHSDEREKSDS